MDQPQFTIQVTEVDARTARFVLEPLPTGYGHTLGNSLRRVLYSSIKGAAITSVTIKGVNHQFTTVAGVREDVVGLILALKQIRLSYAGDKPVQMTLSVKGPGEITAGRFAPPPEITIANPDLVIAHLSDKSAHLEIEATVESGLGYSPAEERKTTTIGVIPVDAVFSPVMRVNFNVEATRVGRMTNFDRLIIEVVTDGTVSPQAALTSAAQTLVDYFQAVVSPQVSAAASGVAPAASAAAAGPGLTIEELDLPTRIANALQKAGLDTVAALTATPRSELARIKNLGTKSVKIIELALREKGIELPS